MSRHKGVWYDVTTIFLSPRTFLGEHRVAEHFRERCAFYRVNRRTGCGTSFWDLLLLLPLSLTFVVSEDCTSELTCW